MPPVLSGYDLTDDGLEITDADDYEMHARPDVFTPNTITFRLLAQEFHDTRSWTFTRVMGLDLVGADCSFVGCPVFAVRDLS